MEKFLQFLDDLDDLIGAFGLIAERLRNGIWLVVFMSLAAVMACGAIILALAEPPLALAMAVMMFVILLYRLVTQPVQPLRGSA